MTGDRGFIDKPAHLDSDMAMNGFSADVTALEMCLASGKLPPPWFLPVEAPPCGDWIEGFGGIRLTCDRPAGHTDRLGLKKERRRQVVDNDAGHTTEWWRPA